LSKRKRKREKEKREKENNQEKLSQNNIKIKQNKTKQNEQNKIKQNKTKQNKTKVLIFIFYFSHFSFRPKLRYDDVICLFLSFKIFNKTIFNLF
jgi:hypothetical protein